MSELAELSDYRDLLQECFAQLKKKDSKYNLSWIAKKYSIDRSFLSFLLTKKRHADVKNLRKLADAFNVPKNRRDYFYLLYLNCQLRERDSDPTLQKIINSYRYVVKQNAESAPSPSPNPFLGATGGPSPYSSRLTSVLHKLSQHSDFNADPIWIKQRLLDPKFSLEEIKESLAELRKKGLLVKKKGVDGKIRYVSKPAPAPDRPFQLPRTFSFMIPSIQSLIELVNNSEHYSPAKAVCAIQNYDDSALEKLKAAMDDFLQTAIRLSQESKEFKHVVSLGAWLIAEAKSKS